MTGFIIGLVAGSAYLGLCVFLYFYQTRLIFRPETVLTQRPEGFQLNYEEVWLPVEAAGQLHGWWLPSLNPRSYSSELVLLYLHGNSDNIGGNLEHAHRYQKMGFSVFLFDYRGYGLSEGPFPSEQRVYEDAAIAWAYLTDVRQIAPTSIWLFGHSLGGAVAIDLALKQPDAAGMIVQSSFSSMQSVVKTTGRYNLVPVDWLLTQAFNSVDKVPMLTMPVLYIHGLEDQTVPASMSQILYEVSSEPKTIWFVPDADHDNVAAVAGSEYFERVESFVVSSSCSVSGSL